MSDNNFKQGPHAAKNKPFSEGDLQEKVSNVDERTTVVLDEDLEGVEFEDKVWLYWKRNKSFIILSLLLAFAIIVGGQAWKSYQINNSNSVALAYESSASFEQRAAFAKEHSGTSLAGLALLENADQLFNQGKFAESAPLYNQAADMLKGSILEARAKLGYASSILQSGDTDKGLKTLEEIFGNANYAAPYKAQAGFILALELKSKNKTAESEKILKAIADNSQNGIYASIANEMLSK